jgi:hypothetical protein
VNRIYPPKQKTRVIANVPIAGIKAGLHASVLPAMLAEVRSIAGRAAENHPNYQDQEKGIPAASELFLPGLHAHDYLGTIARIQQQLTRMA